jgi:hypothetical protein
VRSQVDRIVDSLWLTRNTVPASSRSSRTRCSLRRLNLASPVASASSTSSTSCFLAAAMANRSRAPMPDEYVFIGSEPKSPRSLMPENSMMSLTFGFTSAGDMPMARQPSTTLRSPDRSLSSAALTPSSDGWPAA